MFNPKVGHVFGALLGVIKGAPLGNTNAAGDHAEFNRGGVPNSKAKAFPTEGPAYHKAQLKTHEKRIPLFPVGNKFHTAHSAAVVAHRAALSSPSEANTARARAATQFAMSPK